MDVKIHNEVNKSADIDVVLVQTQGNGYKFPNTLDGEQKTRLSAILGRETTLSGHAGSNLYLPAENGEERPLLLVSTGDAQDLGSDIDKEHLGAAIYDALASKKVRTANLHADHFSNRDVALMANGARLQSYSFDKYKTQPQQGRLSTLFATVRGEKAACKEYEQMSAVTDGVFWARDLVNEPGNKLYPESYADDICHHLSGFDGLTVNVKDVDALMEMGAGGILAVGQGSVRPPRMVVMQWQGGEPDEPPVALVGKGITFDSGGLNIKTSGMQEMTMDMGGSASVAGAMMALAKNRVPHNVVAVIGMAENMPDAGAYRPGDIINSMSGKSVRIVNTDAEGRLVLMDSLWHAQKEFNPSTVIDYATLTGASASIFGGKYGALFSNNENLSRQFSKAGKQVGENVWELPWADFKGSLKDQGADLAHKGGARAGSSVAAAFLNQFIEAGRNWAHIDMAGMAKTDGMWGCGLGPCYPAGATGYGVRQAVRVIENGLKVNGP